MRNIGKREKTSNAIRNKYYRRYRRSRKMAQFKFVIDFQ